MSIHRKMPIAVPPATFLAPVLALLLAVAAPSFDPQATALAQTPAPPSSTGEPEELAAQGPPGGDVTLVLAPGSRPQIRLALPAFEGLAALSPSLASAAAELEETLREDLDFCRYFLLQGPRDFAPLELTGERGHDFEQYRSLDNEYIVLGQVLAEADRLVFEGRLYDLAQGTAVVAKRYRGAPGVARRIAHTFADELVRALTGRRGVALTSIAFTSDRSGMKEIYWMDYDGANARPVTAHKSTSMSSAWAPDASGIAYVSFFSGAPAIYFAAFPSGRKSPLITEGQFNISPSFSPDGRRIAFTRALDGNSEIFVADRDGGNVQRLTYSGAIDANPAWSPTGSSIAFTSSRAGNPHIYLMDSEGANLRRITFEGEYNDGVSWSPDGDEIAYASRRDGVFQIALTNVVTLETRLLTSGRGSKEDPSFSPDGRHLLFTSTASGGKQIYVMDVDGRNVQRLTSQGRNESPAWSPFQP